MRLKESNPPTMLVFAIAYMAILTLCAIVGTILWRLSR
jgi:hypothetical protein